MIKFICTSCGQKYNVEDKHSGKKVKCPKCNTVGIVPDKSDKITFQCESCGHTIRVSESYAGKKGKCPKCQNIVIVPTPEVIPPESEELNTPIPQETYEDYYQEDKKEEYEESESSNRRLIFIISGAALIIVLGIIILAVALRSSKPSSIEEPPIVQDQQEDIDRYFQQQPIIYDTDQSETEEILIDQEPEVISTSQTSGYIDYVAELNELGTAGRSESDNAAPLYQKAIELYVEVSPELEGLVSTEWPAELSADEQRGLRQYLESNSEALSQLELATQKPYLWFELSSPDRDEDSYFEERPYMEGTVITALAQYLSYHRNLSYALLLRAKLSAAEGNFDQAITDIVTCYRFGLQTHTGGPKRDTERLVGIAVRSIATRAAFNILDRTQLNRDFLEELQNQISRLSTDESYILDLRFEKFSLLDIIQRIFTDDGNGDGQINLPVFLPILREAILLSAYVASVNLDDEELSWEDLRRRETIETVEKSYQHIDTLLLKSQWQLNSENADWTEVAKKNIIVEMFFPPIDNVSQVRDECRAQTEALITTLAVLRYEADDGQLPENLDELVASGYLQALPSDPYSNESLTYKRTDEEGFTLYSFSRNLQDDGGEAELSRRDEGDVVFWPVQR